MTDHADRSLLIVEDDKPFLERLRARWKPVASPHSCDSVSDGLAQIGKPRPPSRWWIYGSATATASTWCRRVKRKLRTPRHRADALRQHRTAVTAVKMGAVDYLSKPADRRRCGRALLASGTEKSELPHNPIRPTGALGTHPNASTRCATATSRKPRGG